MIASKFGLLEEWIVKLERCNWPRNLEPTRLIAIRKNLEDAFEFDFNVIIEEFRFYQHLCPLLRSKLMIELFTPFESKFFLFFGQLERLFINEVIINLFARTYKPNHIIIHPGSTVPSVMFIMKGSLAVCEPNGDPFCIFSEGSYIGEF
jgi:hypothetical protein